ncbi:hypothetical protein ACPCSF_09725 [Streptomyces griseoincarnatus]
MSVAIPPASSTRGLIRAAVTSAALLATAAPSATAADDSRATARAAAASSATRAPELTAEQRQFIEQRMGPEALAEIEKAMSRKCGFAFPIAAAAIGCRGMVREGRAGRHSHLGAQRHRCGQGFQREDLRQERRHRLLRRERARPRRREA